MVDTIAANSTTTAKLAIAGSVSSAIDTLGDHDWFAVTLTAGSAYIFNLSGTGAGMLADTYLNLYNAGGSLLAYNDDFGGSTDSQIRFVATITGTYYLDAAAFGNQNTGTYTISADLAPPMPTYTMDQIADYLTTG